MSYHAATDLRRPVDVFVQFGDKGGFGQAPLDAATPLSRVSGGREGRVATSTLMDHIQQLLKAPDVAPALARPDDVQILVRMTTGNLGAGLTHHVRVPAGVVEGAANAIGAAHMPSGALADAARGLVTLLRSAHF